MCGQINTTDKNFRERNLREKKHHPKEKSENQMTKEN